MSLRIYKATLKELNKVDRDARTLVDSAQRDDLELGVPGSSMLHDYAFHALAHARALVTRAKRVRRGLHPNVRAAVH